MSQERLNNLMILHVHNELTDTLDLVHVANEFVRTKESRVRSVGKFACIYVHCTVCICVLLYCSD